MAKREQEESGSPAIDIAGVLRRVACVLEADTDARVARALGVSRAVIAGWRKRGAVPYDRIVAFAQEYGVSLDYLLLNKPPRIDTATFSAVLMALRAQGSGMNEDPDLAYFAALVYNRIQAYAVRQRQAVEIPRSVDLLKKIRAAIHARDLRRRVLAGTSMGAVQEALKILQKDSTGLEDHLPGDIFGPGTELEAAFLDGRLDTSTSREAMPEEEENPPSEDR
jgi:transcriptional regulator with XRE-family HTH domain